MDLDEQGLQKGSNFVRNLRALVASSTNRSLLVKISSSANLLVAAVRYGKCFLCTGDIAPSNHEACGRRLVINTSRTTFKLLRWQAAASGSPFGSAQE